jgi:hypothetical protein
MPNEYGGRWLVYAGGGDRDRTKEQIEHNPDGLYPGTVGSYSCAGFFRCGRETVGVMLPHRIMPAPAPLEEADYVLMLELIDALTALDASSAIPVDLQPRTRLGIKSLRAKIRAAL